MISSILPQVSSKLSNEIFDPMNHRHIEAFAMLTQHGKQHPTLRFHLEHPYLNVRAMMLDKIASQYLKQFHQSAQITHLRAVKC